MSDEDYVSINVDILRTSMRAVHVRCADNIPRWIPRSLIFGPHETSLSGRVGQMTGIKVMRWFAEKEKIPLTHRKK